MYEVRAKIFRTGAVWKFFRLTLVTDRYGPVQSHPLRNLYIGSTTSPATRSISGTPIVAMLSDSACCSACIFVICSNLRHFNRIFIFVDRKTPQGSWSGEYGVGWQPPCCVKSCWTDKASWAGALSLCKSQPFVRRLCGCFLLTSFLRQLGTSLIVRCPPSWMNRRTFFTFSSVRLHDGRYIF